MRMLRRRLRIGSRNSDPAQGTAATARSARTIRTTGGASSTCPTGAQTRERAGPERGGTGRTVTRTAEAQLAGTTQLRTLLGAASWPLIAVVALASRGLSF